MSTLPDVRCPACQAAVPALKGTLACCPECGLVQEAGTVGFGQVQAIGALVLGIAGLAFIGLALPSFAGAVVAHSFSLLLIIMVSLPCSVGALVLAGWSQGPKSGIATAGLLAGVVGGVIDLTLILIVAASVAL